MPYRIRKQKCTDSKGKSGTHVLQKNKNGKWIKTSCHSSKKSAESSMRARGMQNEEKTLSVSLNELRKLIREVLLKNY